jgi:hypothetical protein
MTGDRAEGAKGTRGQGRKGPRAQGTKWREGRGGITHPAYPHTRIAISDGG